MLILLIVFAFGLLLGWFLKSFRWIIILSNRFSFLSILGLLFFLGYQAGNNPTINQHFQTIGIKALVISIFSTLGSILFAFFFGKLFLKK